MSENNLVISMPNYDIVVTFDDPKFIQEELEKYYNYLTIDKEAPRVYTKGMNGVLEIRRLMNGDCFHVNDIVIKMSSINAMFT